MNKEPEELYDIISMEGFDYNNWQIDEDSILRPQLEEAGFYAIHFQPGELDSFGWLSRVVTCIDKDGKFRRFVYS